MNRILNSALPGLLIALFFITGCANTYRDPEATETPVAELATLTIASRGASLRKIDGELRVGNNYRKLELAPGVRKISVFLVSGYTTPGEVTVEFEARAGTHYELFSKVDEDKWEWLCWVVEKGNEDIVSRQVKE